MDPLAGPLVGIQSNSSLLLRSTRDLSAVSQSLIPVLYPLVVVCPFVRAVGLLPGVSLRPLRPPPSQVACTPKSSEEAIKSRKLSKCSRQIDGTKDRYSDAFVTSDRVDDISEQGSDSWIFGFDECSQQGSVLLAFLCPGFRYLYACLCDYGARGSSSSFPES